MLPSGTLVDVTYDRQVTIGRLVGEGRQGAVYEAADDRGGVLALKWYHPGFDTDMQRHLIETLIDRGSPDSRFLWPSGVATIESLEGFGYAMRLRPAEYFPFRAWMRRTVDLDFRTIATIGVHLADAFLRLHGEGLCYRDLNFENVFFEPASGDILVCDTDNIGVEGHTQASVDGTPNFMAPELMRGETEPSTATDRYSLAVMLFFLLLKQHPLDGAAAEGAWTGEAMTHAFGTAPVFIFDPEDTSNRPIPGEHDHVETMWSLLPSSLRHLFLRAFTVGLHDPLGGRVLETEWRAALVAMRDLVTTCPECGRKNLLDDPPRQVACWSCGAHIREPLRLRVGRSTIVADAGAALYSHHLVTDYDFSRRIAEVSQHPTMTDVVGLKNETVQTWSAVMPDGTHVSIEPGRSVRLVAGSVLQVSIAGVAPCEIVVVEP